MSKEVKDDAIDLRSSAAKWLLPRLRWLRNDAHSAATEHMTEDEWNEVLDKMIKAFEWHAADTGGDMPEHVQGGLNLFAKHYVDLWD